MLKSKLDMCRIAACCAVLAGGAGLVIAADDGGGPGGGSSNCCHTQNCGGNLTIYCTPGSCSTGYKCCGQGGCNPDWAYAVCVPLADDCPQ